MGDADRSPRVFESYYQRLEPTGSSWNENTYDVTFPTNFTNGVFTLHMWFTYYPSVKVNIDNITLERID